VGAHQWCTTYCFLDVLPLSAPAKGPLLKEAAACAPEGPAPAPFPGSFLLEAGAALGLECWGMFNGRFEELSFPGG